MEVFRRQRKVQPRDTEVGLQVAVVRQILACLRVLVEEYARVEREAERLVEHALGWPLEQVLLKGKEAKHVPRCGLEVAQLFTCDQKVRGGLKLDHR